MTTSRSGFRILPVLVAFLFNIMAPVLTVAVPTVIGPLAQQAIVSAAGDPDGVSFTLEGCRNPSVDLETHNFVCADGDYTTGNLGKTWNELDLVPHRLITNAGNSAPATQTYTIGIAADSKDAGHPGYDVMSAPVLNAGESDASCTISAGGQQTITPGVGGTDESIGRQLTISQAKNSTCVYDWVERLALGSHLFPGSSLHTNRTNQSWSTQGIGAADVSIPVKEIAPQELSKTMGATQGQTYGWSIEKSANPTSLNFANTCDTSTGARSAQVQVTVTWTRSGPTGSGDITVTTEVTAKNPALRTITVSVNDKIYAGSGQSTLLDQANSGAIDVAPQSSAVVLTHQFVYSGQATSFNDVATATYTDKVTGIAVPGNTTATASATAQPAAGPAANASATITDSESITGAGLAFSVAAPDKGSFSGYTAGTSTTGPVNWSYTANGSGSVTFTKTVTVSGPMNTSGTLSDTAKVMEGETELAHASASTSITASASVSLTITKNIPSDSLTGNQTATFTFDITGPNNYSEQKTLTFGAGDSSKSVTLTGLEPGSYTVHEKPLSGWAAQSDQQVDLSLPTCSSTATFTNSPEPDVSVAKTTSTSVVFAGEPVHYQIVVSAGGTGTSHDVSLSDALPSLASGSWTIDAGSASGCAVNGGSLSCSFGDMASGTSKTVNLSATTSAGDCPGLDNTATVSSTDDSNAENNSAGPVHITVNCPNVAVEKSTSTPVVNAGDTVSYALTVTASGTGSSDNVTLSDTLPAGVTWTVGGADKADCSIANGTLTCDFGQMAPGDTRHITLSGKAGPGTCPGIENSATVTADHDVNSKDNTAGPVAITVACPDVTVLKTADKGTISAGDTAAFTIVVSNDGEGTAYGVTLSDTLPTGVNWSEDSGSCSITSGVLSCDFGAMASGASATVHVWGQTDAADCGILHNTAIVAATNEAEADTANNSSSADITVECPDLAASKTADASPVSAGGQIGFTITVSNSDAEGTGTAHDVALNDPLPAGADLSWSIADQPDGNPCSISGAAGAQTLECSFGDLAPGDSVSVHVVSDTAKADCSTLPNVASVTASNHDELNPQADVTVECPGLNIAKTAADTTINGGDQASFTIVVWNTGPGTAYNVTLNDPLPGGLAWTDDSNACSISGGTLSCDFGDLGVTTKENTPAKVTVTASTTREDCGTLDNLATASADNNDDVTAEASIDVTCPVIRIQKVNDTVAPVLPGTVVSYTLTVTVSDGPALNAEVVDTLPAGLDDPTAISDGGTWSSVDRTITWQFASLDGMKVLTYKAAVSADDTQGQVLRNVAVVTSPNTQCPDVETLGEGCTDDSTVAVRVPTLVIDKAASIDEVHFVFNADGSLKSVTPADRQVTWTLTYTIANGPVTDAVICDPLPDSLTFVSASDGGVIADGSGSCAAGDVEWDLGTVSESGSVTVVTTVNEDAPDGLIDNVATISSNETPSDTGEDSIRVTSEQVEAATPTPKPSVPNTALVLSQNGEPIQVPVELLVLVLLSSLGVLTLVNVKAVRRRR